jgi:hypothetical protein
MMFLREHESMLEEKIEDYLQRSIVDIIRADIESRATFVPSPREIARKYNLQPIFKKLDIGVFDPDDC